MYLKSNIGQLMSIITNLRFNRHELSDIRFKVHFYATFWLRSGLNQSAVS
uniref:Mobile element protein n=1 Tax=Escherichia coli TaxID=562 RepID=A0A890DGN8_ECOLX|nr:Mobile element protein [Escherichia coli]